LQRPISLTGRDPTGMYYKKYTRLFDEMAVE